MDQTTLKLRWNSIENFDKQSIKYKLECFKCIDSSSSSVSSLLKTNNNNNNQTVSINLIRIKSNQVCNEKAPCDSYIEIIPDKNEIYDSKVELKSLDSNTHYFLELYAQHTQNLFKTKTVDLLIQTLEPEIKITHLLSNLTAYQFSDLNQIIIIWSLNGEFMNSNDLIESYEIRYWPLGFFNKANILSLKAPATNFTLRNSNPQIINSNLYIFQLRAKHFTKGWTDYNQPVESIKIVNNNLFYQLIKNSLSSSPSSSVVSPLSSALSTAAVSTREYLYNQFLISKPNHLQNVDPSAHNNLNNNMSFYIIISLLSAIIVVVLLLSLLTLLSRAGRLNFFLQNHRKPMASNMNAGGKIEFTKQLSGCNSISTAQYNQLGICGSTAGTTSTTSGGSSPVWPGKTYIDPHTYEDPTKIVSLFARELPPSQIIIESVIGGGEFGDVCKGRLKNSMSPHSDENDNEIIVAIKTLKGAATEQNRCDFLTEASIMAQFNDPNVIRLEGVVTQSNPLMIVTEFMEHGSLDSFLRLNQSKLKLPQLIKMLKDVASGMKYLSDMNYIHRDLAARNILVNRDFVCKVADFGLSREIDIDAYEYTTKGGKIPIRWTAPESCNFRKYSCASDVWSYGVLVWEVLSYGERPYWNWDNKDVVRAVGESYRLPPPTPQCPDCIYKLMLHCWQEDRNKRPKFNEIHYLLDELLTKYPDELKKTTKFNEILPINPRQPTKVQLTKTRHLLIKLNLEHYKENFEFVGLGNLSNLFHLDANDLYHVVGMHAPYEQKKLLDELKKIFDSYMGMHHHHHQTLYSQQTLNYNSQFIVPTQQPINQQIMTLLRSNSINKQPTDLLTFSVATLQPHNSQSNSSVGVVASSGGQGRNPNGFLV